MLLSIAEIFVCNGGYYFRKIIRNDLSLDMMLVHIPRGSSGGC